MDGNFLFPRAKILEDAGGYCGTGTGPTGQGFAAAAFPYPHLDGMGIHKADKFRIDALGEKGMLLIKWPQLV